MMQRPWPYLKNPVQLTSLQEFKLDSVLLEFDEPEVVVLKDKNGLRRISMASDDNDGDTVRWIEAPLSPEAWRDLIEGRMTMLDFYLLNNTVLVVDRKRDFEPIEGWAISIDRLSRERDLPDVDSYLPKAVREGLTS